MLRRCYDWTMDLAARPNAMIWLALLAFAESSVFPIPPEILIIPMVLAAPTRAWRITAVATAASVLGGLPQDLTHDDSVPTELYVGARNVFREHTTVQPEGQRREGSGPGYHAK